MALNIPSYKTQYSNDPFQNVYAYISFLALDASTLEGSGRIVLNIHPTESDWTNTPIAQESVALGEVVVQADPADNIDEVRVKTLGELMAVPEFAQAFNTIGAMLYGEAMKKPNFVNATPTA